MKALLAVMLALFAIVAVLTVEWWRGASGEAPGLVTHLAASESIQTPPAVENELPSTELAAAAAAMQATPAAQPSSTPAGTAAGTSGRVVAPPSTGSTFASDGSARIRIPTLGVDARIASMGIDAEGVMQVPTNAYDVAWYSFSSDPGAPGNALMGGHVDYGGRIGVFAGLASLQPGDQVIVDSGGRRFVYVVQHTYAVRPEEADVQAIIGARSGTPTLTLITCGGAFVPSIRQYDHRVIVETILISS